MNKLTRFPKEVRERSIRMVFEHTEEHSSQWATIQAIAGKIGMSPETLRKWVRQAERDGGLRPGLTTDERSRMKDLERENRELRRANEILMGAAAFFGAEPICFQLPIAPSTCYAAKSHPRPSGRCGTRA